MKKFLVLLVICICALTGCDKKPTPDYFSDRLVDVELAYAQHPEDIDKPDEYDTTPLITAIMFDRTEIAKFLINNKADTNYIPRQKYGSALGYAVSSKQDNTELINLLIENGAEVNKQNADRETPILHAVYASENTNIKNLKEILKHGADVSVPNADGVTPLLRAATRSEDLSEIIQLLSDNGAELNQRYDDGNTSTLTYCIHFDANINNIQTLIKNGANVNLLTNNKWSALMEAIVRKDKNVIQLLLDNGADANITTEYDNTGLMYLARDENDTSDIMELLLRYGARKDQQNDIGQPALFFAAEHGNINNVKTLLKHGANAKIVEADGSNVLMKTIFQNRPAEIVKLLVKHVDINQKNNEGATALCAAVAVQRHDLVKLLIDNEANVNQYCGTITPLILATDAGNLEIVKYLVDHGADVNAVENDDHKWSALIMAAEKGHLDIVKYLVEHGANIEYDAVGDYDIKTIYVTALSQAIRRNHIDIVKYLISKGASKNGMVWGATTSYNLDTMRYVSEISTEKGTKELKQAVQTCDTFLTNMAHITVKNVPADKQKDIAGTNFAEATYLYVYLTMMPQSKRESKFDGPKHTDIDYLNAYKHTLKELEYRNLLYVKATDETREDISKYFAEKTLIEESYSYLGVLTTPVAFMCTMLSGIINE